MTMDCGDCMYETGGACHRYAPKPQDSNQSTAVWPKVEADQWCGDWRPGTQDWRTASESPHALVLRDLLAALESSTGIPTSSVL